MSISPNLEHALEIESQITALATKRAHKRAQVAYRVSITKMDTQKAEPIPEALTLTRRFLFPLCHKQSQTQLVVPSELDKQSLTKGVGYAFHIELAITLEPAYGALHRNQFCGATCALAAHDATTFKLHGPYNADGVWEVHLTFSKKGAITSVSVSHDPFAHDRIQALLVTEAVEHEEDQLGITIARTSMLAKVAKRPYTDISQ